MKGDGDEQQIPVRWPGSWRLGDAYCRADMVIRAGGIYSVAVTCEADARRFKAMAIRDGQIVALAPGLDGADDLIGGRRCWSTVQA